MKCAVQIYMVLGGFHVYKSVFLGWEVGRFNIAVNGEHNCGVLPEVVLKCILMVFPYLRLCSYINEDTM